MLTAEAPNKIDPPVTVSVSAKPPQKGAGRKFRLPAMRSVFWRIFLWFWLAMIVLAAAVTCTVYLTDPDQFFPRLHSVPLRLIDRLGKQSIAIYEEGGGAKLREYLTALPKGTESSQLEARAHFDGAYLFDLTTGRELSGQTPPDGAKEIVHHTKNNPDLQLERLMSKLLMARAVESPAGASSGANRYAFLLSMPRSSVLLPTAKQLWLHLGAALLTSGLVCYWLAKYVISPVRDLQSATRQIAGGDLTVRVLDHKAMAGRHDEFSELARDFDMMAARIEHLITVQRQLVGDISHELGSPLTRMNVALGIAYRKAGSEVRPELDRIERESNRLNELIRQLLLLSELESREQMLTMEKVDLMELVREVAADAEFEASSRNSRVCVSAVQEKMANGESPATPFTRGSRHLLRSAVENVVRNAVRYTAEDSEVEIEIGKKPGTTGDQTRMLIRVRDHGPGVPPAALENLFRPFYRVSEARDRLSGGTGLGLAITRQAVQAHGGSVSATNHPAGGFLVEIELGSLA